MAVEVREKETAREIKKIERVTKGYRAFYVPVGNVFCWGVYKLVDGEPTRERPLHVYKPTEGYEHMAYSTPWWCPEEKIQEVKDKVPDGFKLCVGKKGGGTPDCPHVIETEYQERRLNGRWHINTKGVPALVGDVLIWLEIEDTDIANKSLINNTAIPCYVSCDIERYNNDKFYKQIYEKANYYFMYYYVHSKPYDTSPVAFSEIELFNL